MTSQCDHIRQYHEAWPVPQELPCAFPTCPDGSRDRMLMINRHADRFCNTTWYMRVGRGGFWWWESVLYEVTPLVCGMCFSPSHRAPACPRRSGRFDRNKAMRKFSRKVHAADPVRERIFAAFEAKERRLTQGSG